MSSPLLDFMHEIISTGKIPSDNSAVIDLLNDWEEFNYINSIPDIAEPIPNAPIENPPRAINIPNASPYVPSLSPAPLGTYNNAPPVGQTGNPEPIPFYKYAPPVGQQLINWRPENFDTHMQLDLLPPVEDYSPFQNLDSLLQFLSTKGFDAISKQ